MKRHENKKHKYIGVGETTETTDSFMELYVGLEGLTDQVVKELVLKGWPKEDLLKARKEGWVYNRIRNSLINRPEIGGDVLNALECTWDGMK